ncbi:MAG: ABC transporter ATP-binding protein [Candidatus Margulisiibacteriota bacterium]|nr:ABC transporter ATP-binding protein [Candidatus Margulisiibacteriota bacterium]
MKSHALPSFLWALKPYKASFVIAIIASIVNKVFDLMPPLLVAWVIDTVEGTPPGWITAILPNQTAMETAVFLAILAVIIFFVESITQWVYQRQFQSTAQHVQHDIRCHTYQHLQHQDLAYFEDQRLGQLIAVVNDDVNQLEHFLNSIFNEFVQLLVLCLFALIVMGITSWQLALFSLIPVPIIIFGSVIYQRLISPFYKRIRFAVGEMVARFENNLSGIHVIKSFTAEHFELKRVKNASEDYLNANLDAIRWSTIYVPIIRMVIAFGFAGVLLLGSYWVLTGSSVITIGELVLFSMMIQRLLWPLTQLGDIFDRYERANVSAMRLLELLNKTPTIQTPDSPSQPNCESPSITFDDVRFNYDAIQTPILNNLKFTIPHGQTVGLAGFTGAGKSTIIKCLLRFYDVSSGKITIDNTNIKAIDLQQLRKMIALVSQDVYLFHGTILENIAYGLSPEPPMEDVIHAAKMAELHAFIETTPDGYNSMIGEKGIKLSGGQRQRLSIARALLKKAPIMVFDEATSSVDTETEAAIQRNLKTLTKGKTALIIAHRLSTIRHADQIMVINNGHISEQGSHDELIKQQGDYFDLWRIQTGSVAR